MPPSAWERVAGRTLRGRTLSSIPAIRLHPPFVGVPQRLRFKQQATCPRHDSRLDDKSRDLDGKESRRLPPSPQEPWREPSRCGWKRRLASGAVPAVLCALLLSSV